MIKTYDQKTYDLAQHFLPFSGVPDDETNRDDLAKTIQQAIEDWFLTKEQPEVCFDYQLVATLLKIIERLQAK